MSTNEAKNNGPPELKRPSVAPYLTVSPASAAIAFYAGAFGATQKALMPALDGLRIMHCELDINGGTLMLADAFPEFGKTRVPIPGEPMSMTVSLEFENWPRLFEQFPAKDKWVSAGFVGLIRDAGCWLRRREGVARPELQPASSGGKFMPLLAVAVG